MNFLNLWPELIICGDSKLEKFVNFTIVTNYASLTVKIPAHAPHDRTLTWRPYFNRKAIFYV